MQPNERMKSSPPGCELVIMIRIRMKIGKLPLGENIRRRKIKPPTLPKNLVESPGKRKFDRDVNKEKLVLAILSIFGRWTIFVKGGGSGSAGGGSTVSNIKTGILRGVYIASENIAGIRQIGHSSSEFLKNLILTATSFHRHE